MERGYDQRRSSPPHLIKKAAAASQGAPHGSHIGIQTQPKNFKNNLGGPGSGESGKPGESPLDVLCFGRMPVDLESCKAQQRGRGAVPLFFV